MRSILLGSGTSIPSARRGSPGLFITADEFGILIDPSSGTLTRLAEAGYMPTAIDRILVTHFHPDHVVDLVPILFSLRNPRFERERRWPALIGPPGLAKLYEQLRAPFEMWIPRAGEEIELIEWSGEPIAAGPFRVAAIPVRHTPGALAYRLTSAGGTVVFSGDTEECDEIVELARGADLLFIECSAPRGARVSGHLDPDGVSRIVRKAGSRRAVLVHLNPECDEVDLLAQIAEDVRERVVLGQDRQQYSTEN